MHGKRGWLGPVSAVVAAVAMGVLAWGMLGDVQLSGPPGVTAPREATAVSIAQPTASGRWCEEGLGCSDAQ